MKTIAVQNKRKAIRPTYPNAADPRYYRDKAIDFALTVAASMGTVTVLMFLTTLA